MIKKTLGSSDLPFFLSKNTFTEDFNVIKETPSIRQSLKNIVLTNKRERPFNVDFGASLYEDIFENYNYEMVLSLQSRIANVITLFEPRVILNDVRVIDELEANYISIIIDFQIRNTGVRDLVQLNLVRNR